MEVLNYLAALVAVLFTIGDSVEVGKLAEVIGEDVRTTKKLLARLQERYEKEDSGIMLSVLENAYQLCSKPAYYESLIKVVKAPRKYILTDALLETLSIIAYEVENSDTCIRRGCVYNVKETASKIKRLILKLENKLGGTKIGQVYVGLGGQSLRSIEHTVCKVLGTVCVVTEEIIDSLYQE